MATIYPALKGRLGQIDYYVVTLKARELANSVQISPDSEALGWEDVTPEERRQCEIDYDRCKQEIAPYLANDPDRFFGALIVAVVNLQPEFKPLAEVASLPFIYEEVADSMGFLVLAGGEVLVPLDGQHRISALKFAIEGKDERREPIPGVAPTPELADEDVTVMLVAYEPERARKIFNDVHRLAEVASPIDG